MFTVDTIGTSGGNRKWLSAFSRQAETAERMPGGLTVFQHPAGKNDTPGKDLPGAPRRTGTQGFDLTRNSFINSVCYLRYRLCSPFLRRGMFLAIRSPE